MIYKQVEKIKEPISVIGLGCWNFGGDWDSSEEQNSINIVHGALDAGINLFDVAPVYGWGVSETILGKALKTRREKAIIASKGGLLWDEDRNTSNNLTKESLLNEIDKSLERLGTDYIDIYQLHWPDPNTPLEETAEALNIMRQAGKIRYVGMSNFSQQGVEAMMGMTSVECQQSLYNMLERNPATYHGIPLDYRTEDEVLPCVEKWGQAFLPYSPLFQGLLSGKFTSGINFSKTDIRNNNPKLVGEAFSRYWKATEEIAAVAKEIEKPMNQVALNWLRQKPAVTSIIGGASNLKQLANNVACCTWDIDAAVMARLDEIIAPFRED